MQPTVWKSRSWRGLVMYPSVVGIFKCVIYSDLHDVTTIDIQRNYFETIPTAEAGRNRRLVAMVTQST